ncbi:MAG: hypothetical protein ACKVJG_07570 [Candidatus Latescibacterota bacterium]|jgi:hypothetical protein
MKITQVIPWLISAPAPLLDTAENDAPHDREYVFVEVQTDEGITRAGEKLRAPTKVPIARYALPYDMSANS